MISLRVAVRPPHFGDHYSYCPNCAGVAYYNSGLGVCYDCHFQYKVISATPVHFDISKINPAWVVAGIILAVTALRKR